VQIFLKIKLFVLLALSIVRNIWFIISILILFSYSSLFLLQKIGSLSTQLVTAASALNAQKVKHKIELKKAVAKEKAKSRLKQAIVAVPFVGSVAYAAMEINDLRIWKKENPGKSDADYACETAQLSAEVLEDVLAEIPDLNKSEINKTLLSLIGDCDSHKKP
jgi:hypothetical protein